MHRHPSGVERHGLMDHMKIGISAAAVGWMGLIFYLSSITVMGPEGRAEGFDSGGTVVAFLQTGFFSVAGHFVLFSILTALVFATLRSWGWEAGIRCAVFAMAASSLFGLSDEYHQSFVTGRYASASDVLVDTIAATVTAAVIWARATSRPRHSGANRLF